MKTAASITVILVLLLGVVMPPGTARAGDQENEIASLSIYSTPALAPLAQAWKEAYTATHPTGQIGLASFTPSSWMEADADEFRMALISGDELTSLPARPEWTMVVGRDVVVPLMSRDNPFSAMILEQGIAAVQLAQLFRQPGQTNWSTLTGSEGKAPVHIYILNDQKVRSAAAAFLDVDPGLLEGYPVGSEEALLAAISADPYAIGFGRMEGVTMDESSDVVLLPIDRNGNGHLDFHEQIYGNLHDFMRGVWIGKYPKSLVDNIYVVAAQKPSPGEALTFAKWMVTLGQPVLANDGYGELVMSERQAKVEALTGTPLVEPAPPRSLATFRIVLLVAIGLAVIGLVVSAVIQSRRRIYSVSMKPDTGPQVISENTLDIPGGLYYDKTHTWVFMDKCGYVKMGVDDFLQHMTGNYTRVQLRTPGEKVKKGEPVVTLVQDGKQLTVHAPVSGTIKAVNDDLREEPALVNDSPYDEGWVYLLEPSNWLREVQFLRMAEPYRDWLRTEFSRLRDFLAIRVNTRSFAYAGVALQEGGELTDHVMEQLGPEVWEEFQKQFVETAY